MDVIILAAGRGTRLQPLTDSLPKPLIKIAGLSLIEIHLYRLAQAGFRRVIINLHHLGALIKTQLGDGRQYGLHIVYSEEQDKALETAGGIVHALNLIESDTFAAISADVLCNYPLQELASITLEKTQGHLVMVNNPAHHPEGDFFLNESGYIQSRRQKETGLAYTFSGLACFRKIAFLSLGPGKRALRPVLETLIQEQQLSGEVHTGIWSDIGTLERLNQARTSESIGAYIESIKASII